MRNLRTSADVSEALTIDNADTISNVGTDTISYYFEVGNCLDGDKGQFVGVDGKSVAGDHDLSRIRTFQTLRAANQFSGMLNGRYGGRPLHLRSNVRKLPLAHTDL